MNILKALEEMQGDHEPSQVTPDMTLYKNSHAFFVKASESKSIFLNRVIYAHGCDEKKVYEEAKSFFSYKVFSWFLDQTKDHHIYKFLLDKGWRLEEIYEGRSLALDRKFDLKGCVLEVEAFTKHVEALVDVMAGVWQTKDRSVLNRVIDRTNNYLSSNDRRGGYLLLYQNQKPVGYATYRLSSCGKYLYLSGSGILQEYRGKGHYKSLLYYRLNKGYELGASYALTQAKQTSSSPILNKFGFKKHGTSLHMLPPE